MSLTDDRALPLELIERRQWVNWALEFREGKATKVPYVAGTKNHALTNDSSTWRDYKVASKDRYGRGVGFVFSADDPFVGIDLDLCRDPETGFVAEWAEDMITTLDSYAEFSPSGKGVHVFVRAMLPPGRRQKKFGGFYERGRYFTMTGQHVPGAPHLIMDRQAELEALHLRYLAEEDAGRTRHYGEAGASSLSDVALIEKATQAKNGPRFRSLWEGNTANHNDDESVADLALCCHLAFWTGNDPARIDALFRQSGLYRDKWDSHRPDGTYGSRTIEKAIAYTPQTYRGSLNGTVGLAPPTSMPSNGHTPDEPDGPFALTDYGNAERLVARHGADIRYCGTLKSWLVWNGRFWEHDLTNQVERYAKETVRAIYAEAGAATDDDERKALSRHALRSEGDSRIKAMIGLATSEPTIPIEPAALDADPWLLNVANGTLDLRAGTLREHDRRDFLTKMAPVEYIPGATLPLWDQFIDEVTGRDAELRAFLCRAVGYSLTGDTREEKLFFVHGPSRAGKSTFLDAVKMLVGSYGMTADFESFLAKRDASGPRGDIARLVGARFVVSIEVDEGRRLAEGLVKMLTGGDDITARFLFAKEFEFKPAFKLWLAANSAPKARTEDDAIWNRIIRIPFEHVVPLEKRDPKVKIALRTPATAGPALLAWAVKGCLEWQRDGLMIPATVRAASEAYRIAVDRLADFIEDCCQLDADAWTASGLLLAEYEKWARASNEKRLLKGKAFAERLLARGCTFERRAVQSHPVRGWKGIRLVDDGAEDAP